MIIPILAINISPEKIFAFFGYLKILIARPIQKKKKKYSPKLDRKQRYRKIVFACIGPLITDLSSQILQI